MIAEIGTDMSVFPTAGHLASWAGLCPDDDQSASKRRSGRTRSCSRPKAFASLQQLSSRLVLGPRLRWRGRSEDGGDQLAGSTWIKRLV